MCLPRATTANWISVLPAVSLEGYIVSIAQEGTVCCLDLEHFLETQLLSLPPFHQYNTYSFILCLFHLCALPASQHGCIPGPQQCPNHGQRQDSPRWSAARALQRTRCPAQIPAPLFSGHESNREGLLGYEIADQTAQSSHRYGQGPR